MRVKVFNKMSFFNLVLLLAFTSVAYGYKKFTGSDITEEKANDYGFCIGMILCVEEKPEVIESIVHAAENPQLYEVFMDAYSTAYGVKAEDTKEWWRTVPVPTGCSNKTIVEEKYIFSEFAAVLLEDFSSNNCEVEESEICIAYFKMVTAADDAILEYKENGVCTDENYAKRVAADQANSRDTLYKMGFKGR